MKKDLSLWDNCINCKVNCCKDNFIARLIFLTDAEKIQLKKINKSLPCKYLDKNGLCEIHEKRPVDCHLFPFDIIEKDKKFFWIIWEANCPITKEKNHKFYPLLDEIEKNIMPNFKKYIKRYSKFRVKEFLEKFKFKLIREVKL